MTKALQKFRYTVIDPNNGGQEKYLDASVITEIAIGIHAPESTHYF